MWLTKEKYMGLVRRIAEAEASNQRLNQYFDMLLRHLRLKVWTESGRGPYTTLVTAEDYQNRVKAAHQGLGLDLGSLGNSNAVQQAFVSASGSRGLGTIGP